MRNAYLLLQSEFEHYLMSWNTISRFKDTFREVFGDRSVYRSTNAVSFLLRICNVEGNITDRVECTVAPSQSLRNLARGIE